MGPPTKRPRVGPSPLGKQQNDDDDDDELNYEPEDVSQMRDPGYHFEQAREFAAYKLKSTFEGIFEKYSKDFTGISDEIDLRTGEIITDNGHLQNLGNEMCGGTPEEYEDEDEGILLEEAFASEDEEEEEEEPTQNNPDAVGDKEERTTHGKQDPSPTVLGSKASTESQGRLGTPQVLSNQTRPGPEQRHSDLTAPPRPGSSSSISIWGPEPKPVDPNWSVPEIPQPRLGDNLMSRLYGVRYRLSVHGPQSVWSSRPDTEAEKNTSEPVQIDLAMLARAKRESVRAARPRSMKLLQALTVEDDDEDDVLGFPAAESFAAKSDTAIVQGRHSLSGESVETHENPTVSGSANEEAKGSQKRQAKKRRHRERKRAAATKDEQLVEAGSKDGKAEADEVAPEGEFAITQVMEQEAQERPQQRFVIELYSRAPPSCEITEVNDPEDANTYASEESSRSPPPDVDMDVSEESSNILEPSAAQGTHATPVNVSSTTVDPTTAAAQSKEEAKEKFTRHIIDPAYDFSDDDDNGIPAARTESKDNEKPLAALVTTDPCQSAAEASTNHQETFLDIQQMQLEEATSDLAASSSPADVPALEVPDSMEVDNDEKREADIEEKTDADLPMETTEMPLHLSRHSSAEQTVEDPASVEAPSAEDAPIPEQFVPRTSEKTGTPTIEDASYSLGRWPIALPQTSQQKDQDQDQDQEEEEDDDKGFIVPFDLDEIIDDSEPEPDHLPEHHVMDQELVAPLSLFQKPRSSAVPQNLLRRHRTPPNKFQPQKEIVSPMLDLTLQPSSPLKGYATSDSLTSRRPAKFSGAATPNKRTSTTSTQPDKGSSSTATFSAPKLTPARPSSASKASTARASSSRPSFVSLLSDDEDELTLDQFKSWTSASGGLPGRKKASYAPVLLAGSQTKITTPMKQHSHNVDGGKRTGTDGGKKRKAAWAFAATPTKGHLSSPPGSLVQTPGGHMRRCGEAGFKCDRDFCFTCL